MIVVRKIRLVFFGAVSALVVNNGRGTTRTMQFHYAAVHGDEMNGTYYLVLPLSVHLIRALNSVKPKWISMLNTIVQ